MKVSRVLFSVLLFAAGGAGGFIAGLHLASERGAPAANDEPAADYAGREAAGGESIAAKSAAVPEAAGARTVMADPTQAVLRGEIDVPEIPAGDGRIAGVVKTATGEPVAGVSIRASPNDSTHGIEFREPHEIPVEDYLRDYAKFHRWKLALHRESLTDEAGRYEIATLPNVSFR